MVGCGAVPDTRFVAAKMSDAGVLRCRSRACPDPHCRHSDTTIDGDVAALIEDGISEGDGEEALIRSSVRRGCHGRTRTTGAAGTMPLSSGKNGIGDELALDGGACCGLKGTANWASPGRIVAGAEASACVAWSRGSESDEEEDSGESQEA